MQHVNLYQEEFHTTRDQRKVIVIGVILLMFFVLAGINLMQMHKVGKINHELVKKNQTIASLDKSYAVLKKSIKPKAKNMALVAEVEDMKHINSEKKRALNYLNGNNIGNTSGFSYLMEGLGRQRDKVNDLWLRKIRFTHGGYDLRLAGSSYEPDLLPDFVQALNSEKIYRGREFKEVKMTRSNGKRKIMDFFLDTQLKSSDKSAITRPQSVALFMERLKKLAIKDQGVQ